MYYGVVSPQICSWAWVKIMLLRDVPGVFSMSMSMSSLISYKTIVIFDIIPSKLLSLLLNHYKAIFSQWISQFWWTPHLGAAGQLRSRLTEEARWSAISHEQETLRQERAGGIPVHPFPKKIFATWTRNPHQKTAGVKNKWCDETSNCTTLDIQYIYIQL